MNKNIKIQFGILVWLGITNKHYLQDFDRVERYLQKIDTNNYLKPFDPQIYTSVEDMINDEVKEFEDDAKWIKSLDGSGFGTTFYVVCYTTDKNGNPESIEKIKKLYYDHGV